MEGDGFEAEGNGEILGPCLSSYVDDGSTESHRYYLARRTVLEMLTDRGYAVPTSEIELSIQDFRAIYGQNPDVERLRISTTHRSDPLQRILVIFCVPGVVKLNVIRSVVTQIVNKETLSGLILIVQNHLTTQALKAVDQLPFKAEIFQITDLLVNITKHVLKPNHRVLTEQEKQRLLKKYNIQEKQNSTQLSLGPASRTEELKTRMIQALFIQNCSKSVSLLDFEFLSPASPIVAKRCNCEILRTGEGAGLYNFFKKISKNKRGKRREKRMSDTPVTEAKSGSDASRFSEVQKWLAARFGDAGKEVPDFEYTPRSVAYLHSLLTVSEAKEKSADIVAKDFRRKAAEYRSQAARIREILESAGLAQDSLPSNVVGSAQVLANVANLLNVRDTELSSFLVAMGDISLRKTGVEEKRAKVQKESKILLDYTRKAIARLTYLKRTLAQLEDDLPPCEAQMENWKTNLQVMAAKERQYMQQCANYKLSCVDCSRLAPEEVQYVVCVGKGVDLACFADIWHAVLNRVGYSPEISHGVLVEMAEHRKELEKKTKPILDTLRSYQDLPPDKAMAALAIEDKKRQYAGAEKYLEESCIQLLPLRSK
ncbi:DNA-directed RNA polymerase V subunit 5A [Morella rubra]|uniref:DNA-directed RNA polymerase V subunit 5A n=1 Tax=Morella rubra TaxID=262757 RepID=A0A6A1WAH2_9ROSI|nr:DNA-directed RNA polymerase V subunit 5A [Morella rubra]